MRNKYSRVYCVTLSCTHLSNTVGMKNRKQLNSKDYRDKKWELFATAALGNNSLFQCFCVCMWKTCANLWTRWAEIEVYWIEYNILPRQYIRHVPLNSYRLVFTVRFGAAAHPAIKYSGGVRHISLNTKMHYVKFRDFLLTFRKGQTIAWIRLFRMPQTIPRTLNLVKSLK